VSPVASAESQRQTQHSPVHACVKREVVALLPSYIVAHTGSGKLASLKIEQQLSRCAVSFLHAPEVTFLDVQSGV
jgi:hypothetical protein